MTNLFKKAAVFTDIHFGLKSNSLQHNQDCLDFVEWFISKAKEEGCETCLFLGDWNHHRASINMHTLQFGLRALEKLNDKTRMYRTIWSYSVIKNMIYKNNFSNNEYDFHKKNTRNVYYDLRSKPSSKFEILTDLDIKRDMYILRKSKLN
jgi:DNA repair exonuclease SbcCD nuclease subunit